MEYRPLQHPRAHCRDGHDFTGWEKLQLAKVWKGHEFTRVVKFLQIHPRFSAWGAASQSADNLFWVAQRFQRCDRPSLFWPGL